jgi:hypothetical protein
LQNSRSTWQDLCLVVCTSCNQDASFTTRHVTPVARRSQMSIRPATTFSGNSFCRIFFLFSFLAKREHALGSEDCLSKGIKNSRSTWQDSVCKNVKQTYFPRRQTSIVCNGTRTLHKLRFLSDSAPTLSKTTLQTSTFHRFACIVSIRYTHLPYIPPHTRSSLSPHYSPTIIESKIK